MPNDPVPLVPGGEPVHTSTPALLVAPMKKTGKFVFTLAVVDAYGATGSGSVTVTVKLG